MQQNQAAHASSPKLKVIGLILAIIGAAISVYSITHHLDVRASGQTDAFCNINATFNCDDVAQSEWAEVGGAPLGVWGVGYFLALMVLIGTAFFKEEHATDTLRTWSFLTIIGAAISLGLGILSWVSLGTLCITCIGIYLVTFLQWGLYFANRQSLPPIWDTKSLMNGATYAALTVAVVFALFKFLKPPPADFKEDIPLTKEALEAARQAAKQRYTILGAEVFQVEINKSQYSGMGEDYRTGSDSAKVNLVEFADFQCPACANLADTLKQVKDFYGNQITVVFKNYPLDQSCNDGINRSFHEFACQAAIYSRCAGLQGKFWAMHDKIFANQKDLSSNNLVLWAKEIGLTKSQLKECEDSKDIAKKIKDDIQQGGKLNISGTPALFINGRKVVGNRGFEDIKMEIDRLLE
ncbi:MAG: hypothetical protein CMP10_15205 [Zetaproteobacteria bacterium]|nr:hypothetical protein [Pseudobdellovibrionaceae bacterium]